jgi:hypothetical protein
VRQHKDAVTLRLPQAGDIETEIGIPLQLRTHLDLNTGGPGRIPP